MTIIFTTIETITFYYNHLTPTSIQRNTNKEIIPHSIPVAYVCLLIQSDPCNLIAHMHTCAHLDLNIQNKLNIPMLSSILDSTAYTEEILTEMANASLFSQRYKVVSKLDCLV
uniref:Uncharacterized protein n=1 Tax=Arundo donax TaxID=35708 RepID=A0A0A9DUU4_ARUDO